MSFSRRRTRPKADCMKIASIGELDTEGGSRAIALHPLHCHKVSIYLHLLPTSEDRVALSLTRAQSFDICCFGRMK